MAGVPSGRHTYSTVNHRGRWMQRERVNEHTKNNSTGDRAFDETSRVKGTCHFNLQVGKDVSWLGIAAWGKARNGCRPDEGAKQWPRRKQGARWRSLTQVKASLHEAYEREANSNCTRLGCPLCRNEYRLIPA